MSSPRDFIDAYISAYEALDVEAFLSLYADDVRVFDAAEPAEYPTKETWRAQVEGWFGALEGEADCDFDDVQIIEADDLAVVTAHIEHEGVLAGTDEEVEVETRATFVLQKLEDQWRVVHEHTSIPVEIDDEDDDEDDEEWDDDEDDDSDDHAGHDHAGHDHAGHDHAGHDHAGHDHAGHDHAGHDHGAHGHGAADTDSESVPTEAVNQ
ncbi:nuclear transport factor 2 family protein [Tessaracoccus sp. OS52]|uniref:YybH family protein n=1 Tax=Tessaracoccus sp. OS52 TaxID=2886691 RepID=UPI001D10978E|nr:nuclear transport factor 2 family protein [Tessaracoccus sp. OS52]MCC2593866.1 nuclear transport factor 2 family protein [Tessaracoccus sp. OS52]